MPAKLDDNFLKCKKKNQQPIFLFPKPPYFCPYLKKKLSCGQICLIYLCPYLMITTYGIVHGIHSGIVQNEVTMDDLFA